MERNDAENGERELGSGERTAKRHRGLQSGAGDTTEETRTAVGDQEIEGAARQERRDERRNGADDTGADGTGERSVGEDAAGRASADDDAGDGERGDKHAVSPNVDGNKPAENPGHNYHITDADEIGAGGAKTKFKQNIAAIELLKKLEAEGRRATPEEQAVPAQFNGWGTVVDAFTAKLADERDQLKELLTPEEYRAAESAIRNAFYTSPEIVKAMWMGMKKLGFQGGRVLEPSMGSGLFFGLMPQDIMTRSELTGVEKDSLTGQLARQLYQRAAIDVMGFEEKKLPNNYFDLAISNVPFGDITILSDPDYSKQKYNLHNYFFAKAMDKVRPGGLVAFITSSGTMQTTSSSGLRRVLDSQADLIAAFKLPSNAFKGNAGMEVTTDLLILQKRVDPRKPSKYGQKWNEIERILVPTKDGGKVNVEINKYYQEHPEHMLGKPMPDKLWYSGRLALDGTGRDFSRELTELMNDLPADIYQPPKPKQHDTVKNTKRVIDQDNQRERSYSVVEGKAMQKRDGYLVEVPKKNQSMVKEYLRLMSKVNNLLLGQLSPAVTDKQLATQRTALNKAYDEFVGKYGYLNSAKVVSVLGSDPNYGRVAALEKYSLTKQGRKIISETAEKADIFRKRTVRPISEPTHTDSAEDALGASLSV